MAELAVTEPPSPPAGAPQPLPPLPSSTSPSRRAWQRFKRNRLGFWSLVICCTLVALSLLAEADMRLLALEATGRRKHR